MNMLINEELNKMKYLLGYQRGMVISEQAVAQIAPAAVDAIKSQNSGTAAPQAVEDVVKQIQTILNTKYGTKLAVDGKWGNLTQTAFETAVKSKTAAPAAPAASASSGTTAPTSTTTAAPAAPAAPVAAAPTTPAAENPEDIVGAEVAQPTRRDQRRERQDLRRSNRRAMQDLRTQQNAQ